MMIIRIYYTTYIIYMENKMILDVGIINVIELFYIFTRDILLH